jgi:hypothetical protein
MAEKEKRDSLVEVVEKRTIAVNTRAGRELAALEATEQSAAPKKKKKKKAVPKENVGTGRDDSQANFERLAAGIRRKMAIAEAAGNTAGVATLQSRLDALKETVQ